MTPSQDEIEAQAAIQAALQALVRADELSERAGYGSLILGPLSDAIREVRYALDVTQGRA